MPGRQKPSGLPALFGQRVREERLAQGLTQEALGELCGLHWTYIGGIERGERNPTLAKVEQIAAALKTAPVDLLQKA